MPTFIYSARTKSGEKVDGSVEAVDRSAALIQIEALGHIPVSVKEGAAAAAGKRAGAKKRLRLTLGNQRKRMGTRDLLTFTTELSDLLRSGMTLGNALNALSRRGSGRPGDAIITDLRDEIIRGSSLSYALSLFPDTFSTLYVNMVRAGEVSGAMAEVLQRLVIHYERVQEVKDKVVMALVYPTIVMILGAVTLVFSMLYVVPKFKVIFDQLGETLPLPTRMLIASSSWLAHYGWLAAILIVGASITANRALKTQPRVRRAWDRFLLNMPLVRGVVASGIYANFARTLGTLMANGVPVLQALSIVENTVGNLVVSEQIHAARELVTDGTTISRPLADGKVFPGIMTDMMAVGEETGNMTGSLEHVAHRYEGELDRNVKIFTTALEPILIVLVAVVVGFVAVSILMAVFNLTNGLNV